MHRTWLIAACMAMAPLRVDALDVVADIAPIHSLVAMVTGDVATPEMLIAPSASPHSYAMRPSEASRLEKAQIVFWVGPELTPWLEGPIETLAGKARVVSLLDHPQTMRLPWRENMAHDDHDHGDDHAAKHGDHDHGDDHAATHGDHGHGDDHAATHGDHGHGDDHAATHGDHDHGEDHAATHGDHDHGEDHAATHGDHDHGDDHAATHGDHDHGDDHAAKHGDHDHGADGHDPHAWLDPGNASLWLGVIAEELGALDPANAAAYQANAEAAQADLAALTGTLGAQLTPFQDKGFVVYHDAYHYFEQAFGVRAVGAVSLGDASSASAARVAALRETVGDFGVGCAMSEPQFDTRILSSALGDGIHLGVLDPLGSTIAPGASLYPALLQDMAAALVACLDTGS